MFSSSFTFGVISETRIPVLFLPATYICAAIKQSESICSGNICLEKVCIPVE